MMKNKILLTAFACTWAFLLGTAASALSGGSCGENARWSLSDGTLTISGSGATEAYAYNTSPWYAEREKIETLKIENGITEIGNNAFRGCSNLSSVSFGNDIEYIGDFAFYGTAYKSVCIPASLKKIGSEAFGSYNTITVASDNESFSVSSDVLFTDEGRTLLYYPSSKTSTSYTVPYAVEEIASRAFNNSYLKTVTFSSASKLVKIGDYAFWESHSITSLKSIPTSLREVGRAAVYAYSASYKNYFSASYNGTRTLWNTFVTAADNDLTDKLSYGSATHPNHPICGDTCHCTDTHHVPISWSSWNGKSNLGSSCYYLSADVTRETLYNIYGTVCICLNDHQINTNGESEGFTIQSTGNLTVTDCGENGAIMSDDGNDNSSSSAELAIYNEGKFKLYNGSLSAGAEALYNVSGASAIIYGGAIYGTDTAIWNFDGGDCNIMGGKISCPYEAVDNGGTCTIENAELNGTIYNSGDLIMKNVSMKFDDTYFSSAVCNAGTCTAEKLSIVFSGGACGHSIQNGGTVNLKDVNLPASKDMYRQYFSIYNTAPKSRCYLYGNSEISAIGADYAETFSFASSNGSEALSDIGALSVYVNGKNLTDNSTVISNISENVAEKVTQINLYGAAAEEDGVLRYSNNSVKFAKYIASGTFGENLAWRLTGDGVLSISGNGSMKNEVPWKSYGSSIKKAVIGDGVTDISDSAFHFCPYLTEAAIGKSVTHIGMEAFCTSKLESVDIPDSVLSIGAFAFEYCPLKTVKIGKGLKEIGKMAFRYNNNEEYIIDNENPNFKVIDGNIYTKDGKTLVRYAIGKKETSFTIPETVTKIGVAAFESACNLKNIVIPKSVIEIDDSAFWLVDSELKQYYLNNVYYFGTEDDWNIINISGWNYAINSAKKHYNYCYTKTSIAEDKRSFVVSPVNVPESSCVILALYKDGALAEVQSTDADGQCVFYTDVSYDEGKVLVWESLSEPTPLCAEEILK